MATMCSKQVKVWQNNKTFSTFEQPGNSGLVCVSDDGRVVVVHREQLTCHFWLISDSGSAKLSQEVDLLKSIQESGNPGFVQYQSDAVISLRIVNKHLRVAY